MTLQVCVGSACHLRGSYEVLENFTRLIKQCGLTEKIELGAAFCLGHCAEGVTIRVDDEIITGLTPENVKQVFSEKILPRLGQ